jgi:hypothetical protein
MRTMDARTILQNMTFDVNRMLEQQTNSRQIYNFISKKMQRNFVNTSYQTITWE